MEEEETEREIGINYVTDKNRDVTERDGGRIWTKKQSLKKYYLIVPYTVS